MSNHGTVRLGDVATYINGYAFKPSDWSDNGLPIIRIQNLTGNDYQTNYYNKEYNPKYLVKKGDVLISWSASLGVFVWKKEDALLNQHIFKVVFDKIDVDKDYFCLAVEYLLKRMGSEVHGSTMKHITKPRFDNTIFPLPDKNTQRLIAKKITTADEIINKCKLKMQKLDELVKSRFVEMFGDPILNPKGWEMTTIGEIVTEVKYGTSRPAIDGGKYAYLRMNNLTYDGYLDLADLKRIDIPDSEIEKCIVRKGDVLFNRTNSIELVGKTCVFDKDEDMIIAGYIIRVRLKPVMLPLIMSYFMNTDALKKKLRSMAKGAVNQANINAQELKAIKIYLPPTDLQQQFADFVAQTDKSKLVVKKQIEKLETLKKSLMQEYFG